jgi:hypothetical protein
VLTVNNEQERIASQRVALVRRGGDRDGRAGVYTIVTFRLTERKGGNCGSGVGGKARGRHPRRAPAHQGVVPAAGRAGRRAAGAAGPSGPAV